MVVREICPPHMVLSSMGWGRGPDRRPTFIGRTGDNQGKYIYVDRAHSGDLIITKEKKEKLLTMKNRGKNIKSQEFSYHVEMVFQCTKGLLCQTAKL